MAEYQEETERAVFIDRILRDLFTTLEETKQLNGAAWVLVYCEQKEKAMTFGSCSNAPGKDALKGMLNMFLEYLDDTECVVDITNRVNEKTH